MGKMRFYLNKKFFKRYFAAFSVSLFIIITIIIAAFGNYAASRQKYKEQIKAFSDFEEKRKNVENTLSIAVSLGRITAESENVKEFAGMQGEYYDGNYFAITKIHQSLKQSQSDFHYMEFKIWMFTEQNELVISGSETMSKTNLKKESGISAASVVDLFDDNQNSGYYATLIPDSKNEKRAFIACRQTYDNGSSIYLLISLPNNTYAYSKKYNCGFIMDKQNSDIWKQISADKMFFSSATVRSDNLKKRDSVILYANIESMPKLVYVCKTYPQMATVRTKSQSSDIVVAGGKGVADKMDKIRNLAEKTGGTIGASRGLVDMNKVDYRYQIGLTGKTIAPLIYIAVGISGAIQHTCGIENAKTVIAINPDKNARIFEYADYGITASF